jgi:hypothetical protein
LVPPIVVSGRVVWEGADRAPELAALRRPTSMFFEGAPRPSDDEVARMVAALPVSLVTLLSVDPTRASGQNSGALWSADSRFTLAIRPGRFLAEDARVNGWFLKSFRINGHEAIDEPMDIDASTTDAVLTLTRAMGEVRGTIVTSDGRADAGSMVVLFSTNPRLWPGVFATQGPHVLEEGCDASGHFTLPNVLPGEYYLAAAAALPWDQLDEDLLRRLAASAVRVQVLPNAPVERVLTRRR